MKTLNRKWVNRLLKSGVIFLVMISVFFLILSVSEVVDVFEAHSSERGENTITISGTGEATAIPNAARFTVGITHEADTAQAAQGESTAAINDIVSYLEGADVAEENIKTINYNISPRYDYVDESGSVVRPPDGTRELTGYEVSQTLEITTGQIDQAGQLLSGVTENGADSVSNLSFVLEDESSLTRAAKADAIANARENASELARALKVDLGNVVGFSETNGGPTPYRLQITRSLDAAAESAPQVPAGENRVEATVEVTFEID